MTTVMLSVGDTSGDAYAADLIHALRELRPSVRFAGLGGDEMLAAGAELVAHQRALAVGGIAELLPDLHSVVRTWFGLCAALDRLCPDLLILVDSGGFNIPFAGRARRRGIPVLYYVCPQVWAWRRHRIRKIARRVDRLVAILPFEGGAYADSGPQVDYVGHPLVDRMRSAMEGHTRESAREALGLEAGAEIVALLPGSRRDELRHCLPLHLAAARALHRSRPRTLFLLPVARSLERSWVEGLASGAGLPTGFPLHIVDGQSERVLIACDAALAKPGTCTLEAALLGRPLVVAARASALTAAILRRLLRVDSLTMPNLIAGADIVPEYLQEAAMPEPIAAVLAGLLQGPARVRQLQAFESVRDALGGGGAAHRAAAIAEEMIVARRQ